MKISYNWLKWYIDGELPSPEKLADIFTFKLCEVESMEKLSDGDTLFDLNILPNRAHDLLSHQGVAREVAGMLEFKFKDPTSMYKVPESRPTDLKVEIKTPNCRRYMGRIVRNIKVGPSPDWVVKHLESVGQRSINNIVDATNLVMLDSGNPCHAFDLKKSGSTIVITNAKDGEEFAVLGRDQVVAKLKNSDMVIADAAGNTLAIAGVKGGLTSGVTDETAEIVLEIANFEPSSVRKTARRLNLLSDSAKRFENDLSAEHATYAMRELSATILEMCPEAQFEDIVDVYPNPEAARTVSFSVSKINAYLGTSLSENEMVKILDDYGYEITGSGDTYTIAVPYLRLDIMGMHDIAEEVARLYGLENIKAQPVVLSGKAKVNGTFAKTLAAKEKLITDGYREVITYMFRKKGDFEVARGVGDKPSLRTNLSDGIKEAFELNRLNAPFLELKEVKIFEIGAVFTKTGEEIHIAWADKKGITEMTLDEYCQKNNVSILNYSDLLKPKTSNLKPFSAWSNYPFITRDIAAWVPEGKSKTDFESIVTKVMGDLVVKGPYFVDEFTKDGKTSVAYRLVFQSFEKTLEETDVAFIMQKITDALVAAGFEVR